MTIALATCDATLGRQFISKLAFLLPDYTPLVLFVLNGCFHSHLWPWPLRYCMGRIVFFLNLFDSLVSPTQLCAFRRKFDVNSGVKQFSLAQLRWCPHFIYKIITVSRKYSNYLAAWYIYRIYKAMLSILP